MKFMTPKQYINNSMNLYPIIYTSNSVTISEMKVADQLFNVIGNGIRDLEEFKEAIRFRKITTRPYPKKYVSNESLFYGYKEIEDKSKDLDVPDEYKDRFKYPVFDSMVEGLYTKEEKASMPEVVYWVEKKKLNHISPYSNFSKKYSIIWKDGVVDFMSDEWLRFAMEYYEYMRYYFSHPALHCDTYYDSPDYDFERRIDDFEERFVKYRKEGMSDEEYYAAISEAYNFPYDGDTEKFVRGKWEKELDRIRSFIEETIQMLNDALLARKKD